MQEKLILLLTIAGAVALFSVTANFWERHQMIGAMGETLSPGNSHTFKDRKGVEDALYDIAYEMVGEDAKPDVELWHYRGQVWMGDIDTNALPTYGGVETVGDQVRLSALVGRVWWYQKTLWYWEKDVSATKVVFVDAEKLGSQYRMPPAKDYEFVDEPGLLLDASR